MATYTTRFGLQLLTDDVVEDAVVLNVAMQTIDYFVRPKLVSATTTAPPGSPSEGDMYRVPTGATGAWQFIVGAIVLWRFGAWIAKTPTAGFIVQLPSNAWEKFNGTTWTTASFT